MSAPLMVVDAPSVLFRAYYALPSSITGVDQRPVNALLGSVNIMLREIAEHAPRAVVMCFGAEAATYRTDAYPAYHADRELEAPDELSWQWAQAPGLYQALGWQLADVEELEADDLLGAYANAEAEAGGRTLILTGDRDLYQCVDDHTTVLYLTTKSRGAEPVDADEVMTRYGVRPDQVTDFIALRGDPSDGLPGAKGIGAKRAADLLRVHGDLETAIASSIRDTSKVVRALGEQAELLRTFRDIATLRPVAVERPPDAHTDTQSGAEAARALGMEQLAERLEEAARG